MFQVRTLANQRVATSGPSDGRLRPWFAADEEQAAQEDCASYLECLFVYMVALYVEFPLDLAWKYQFRAMEASKKIGERMKLPHISSLDRSERAAWCQKYSTGTEKLGAIVYRIFMERDVHWSAVTMYPQGSAASGPPPEPTGTPALPEEVTRRLGSFRPLSAMEQTYMARGSMDAVIGNVRPDARMVSTVVRAS